MNNTHTMLGRSQAAEYLGVSTTALDRLTRKGYIAYIEAPSSGKKGRPSRKWTIGDLNDFIDSRRRLAVPVSVTDQPKRRRKRRAVSIQGLTAADILEMDSGVRDVA